MSDYQRFEVKEAILLRDFLEARISNKALKSLKKDGDIKVNQVTRTVRHFLNVGDIVELYYPNEAKDSKIIPWYFPLHVIYEDEYLMVVNKPKGMPSIPNKHYAKHTLANVLTAYYEMNQIGSMVHLVSRLDKDTSGLILVAKSRRMHQLLIGAFERKYVLLVEGNLKNKCGTIDAPIEKEEGSVVRRCVRLDGKRAVTHYQVLKQNELYSLVEAKLETGRTHQIRVHFSHMGYPLVGDLLYGKAHPSFNGQALHSYYLKFIHPITSEEMVFENMPNWYEVF